MDKSEINRRMATEVMGWHSDRMVVEWYDEREQSTGYCQEADMPDEINKYKYYNPAEDMNQAMMGIDKLMDKYFGCSFKLVKVNSCHDYRAIIEPGLYLGIGDKKDKLPATAICLALLEAVKQMKKEN